MLRDHYLGVCYHQEMPCAGGRTVLKMLLMNTLVCSRSCMGLGKGRTNTSVSLHQLLPWCCSPAGSPWASCPGLSMETEGFTWVSYQRAEIRSRKQTFLLRSAILCTGTNQTEGKGSPGGAERGKPNRGTEGEKFLKLCFQREERFGNHPNLCPCKADLWGLFIGAYLGG